MNRVSLVPDTITDCFGRILEYQVHNVPYESEDAQGYVFSGAVVNRVLELRNTLRQVAEQKNTERRHWFFDIDYHTRKVSVRH